MERSELLYIIGDYCAQYEIEITSEAIEQAADCLSEAIDLWAEYNERCGRHSVNVDCLLDKYFEEWDADA